MIRLERHVGVQLDDDRRCDRQTLEPSIERMDDRAAANGARLAGKGDDANPAVLLGELRGHCAGPVRRTVVDDNPLNRYQGLVDHGLCKSAEAELLVPRRGHERICEPILTHAEMRSETPGARAPARARGR